MARFLKEGFETTMLNPFEACPDRAVCTTEEIVLSGSRVAVQQEFLRLLDFSLFRATPAPSKRLVWNGGGWRIRNWSGSAIRDNRPYRGQKVLQILRTQAFVSRSQPTAKFIHVFITHLPPELDVNCRPLPKPSPASSSAILTQARCAIEAVAGLVDHLKRLKIYDGTSIIVTADHGLDPGYPRKLDHTYRGSANPLLLFKPRGHRGPLQILRRPAHISDVPAMACQDLDACPDFCYSPASTVAPVKRERVYYRPRSDTHWTRDRVPKLESFTITGPVRSIHSWYRLTAPFLRPGKLVAFNTGSSADYLNWGWSAFENWGIWNVGEWASLSFSVDEGTRKHALRLVATTRAYLNTKHPKLTVTVHTSGADPTQWHFDLQHNRGERDILLPPQVWSQTGSVTVHFHIDRPASPSSFGKSKDARPLGIGLESLVLHRM